MSMLSPSEVPKNDTGAVAKHPCPRCRESGEDSSGDNLVVYPDGRGAHCFACGAHLHGDGHGVETARPSKGFKSPPLRGQVRSLPHRRIDERTARLFDYRVAKIQGEVVEISNFFYPDGSGLQAQHIRWRESKDFRWKGDTNDLPLFGQHLWNGKGRRIVVTEGEIDAMTVSLLWSNRWPVVSIPNGVDHAAKAIKTNLTFLSGYDEIVLCFDMDEPGRKAAQRCAELLPPGRVRIANLPYKDANACLERGEAKRLLSAIYEAPTFQPDGVLHSSDINGSGDRVQKVWTFPFRCLTRSLMGQRSGEMTLWASGTGSGKSTVMRELVYHHLLRGRRVGSAFLEESPSETMDDLIGLRLEAPVRQIRAARELNEILRVEGEEPLDFQFNESYSDDEYEEAVQFFKSAPLYFYDHHGTNDFGNILPRIEYMAVALECDVVIIDHITAVVAGMGRSGSERESIDDLMRQLRSLVERTGVHLDVVSQLNRLEGKAAEEGGRITLKNLRGSGSLGSVPNSVIAIERDQQAEDPDEQNIIKVRSLKGRFNGKTGIAGILKYNTDTRRLEEAEWKEPHERSEEAGQHFEPEPEDLESLLEEG